MSAVSDGDIAQVSPLGTAAFCRSTALAALLIDAGAEVDGHGPSGFTALHAAAENGDLDLIRLLLERGASPTAEDGQGRRPSDLAKSAEVRELLGAVPE